MINSNHLKDQFLYELLLGIYYVFTFLDAANLNLGDICMKFSKD